jgi:hypothetical protein
MRTFTGSTPAARAAATPFGYFRRADGLFGDPGGDAPPVWLAAPFEVLGETRDAVGAAWGLWLRWQDGDGTLHSAAGYRRVPGAPAHPRPRLRGGRPMSADDTDSTAT